jgi:hypothetical protein
MALPLVAAWYLRHFRPAGALAALALTAAGVAGGRWLGPRFTAVRLAFAVVAVILLFRLVMR